MLPARSFYALYDWSQAAIADALCPEEARFWLTAMTTYSRAQPREEVEADLARRDYRILIGYDEMRRGLRERSAALPAEVVVPLANLLSPAELIELMLNPELYNGGPLLPGHPPEPSHRRFQ
jgi:hypothetical protein